MCLDFGLSVVLENLKCEQFIVLSGFDGCTTKLEINGFGVDMKLGITNFRYHGVPSLK
jgi:hypothetical protein